jgi:hypothetical protein
MRLLAILLNLTLVPIWDKGLRQQGRVSHGARQANGWRLFPFSLHANWPHHDTSDTKLITNDIRTIPTRAMGLCSVYKLANGDPHAGRDFHAAVRNRIPEGGRAAVFKRRQSFRSHQAGSRGVAQCDQPDLPRRPDATLRTGLAQWLLPRLELLYKIRVKRLKKNKDSA